MLGFAVDENFNMHIVNGVLRRLPTADIMRVQDAGLEGAEDPAVLEWAASESARLAHSRCQHSNGFCLRPDCKRFADAGRV